MVWMEIAAHWSVLLCMSKLKIYFCKAYLYFFCQIDLPLLYFSKAFVEKKNYMAILLYFSTEYLLSVKHRKLNFTKKLRNFSHAFYTGLIRFVRYDTFLIYAIQYVFQTIRYVSYKIRYGSWQIRYVSYTTLLIRF